MSRQPAVLALDQGTTGSTALVVASDGRILGRGYSEFTQHFPRPGRVEHDAEEIWRVTRRVARAALDDAGGEARLEAIGIANQRETVVLWDRASLEPVCRAIVWQDRRTASICTELRRGGHESEVRRRTGLVLDPYFSGTKLTWLFRERPELRSAAEAGDLAAGTIDAWLVARLTGGAVHATDHTNASRTLLYDLHRRAWDPSLADLLEVPAGILPEVRSSSGDFGAARGEHLGTEVPVAGVVGDQQAALFGQGCIRAGLAKVTYGTGAFLLLHTGQEVVPSENGLLTTLACDARGGPAYALEGSIFSAGASVQWLRDGLGILDHAAESEERAREVADNAGVYFVPAFVGLGAPPLDPRGARHGGGHYARDDRVAPGARGARVDGVRHVRRHPRHGGGCRTGYQGTARRRRGSAQPVADAVPGRRAGRARAPRPPGGDHRAGGRRPGGDRSRDLAGRRGVRSLLRRSRDPFAHDGVRRTQCAHRRVGEGGRGRAQLGARERATRLTARAPCRSRCPDGSIHGLAGLRNRASILYIQRWEDRT